MTNRSTFFKFVIPSIISFALAGVYSIVDGLFVGNTIGDAGLSAINIAYPLVALTQSVGTGLGMGGAVYYSINKAEGNEKRTEQFITASLWLLLTASILFTTVIYAAAKPVLSLLGASGTILDYATQYIKIIALGTILQIFGTGLVPFIRNYGTAFWAMITMLGGFITNIIFDYLLVWVFGQGMIGAALATIIGQGVTCFIAIVYAAFNKKFLFRRVERNFWSLCKSIFRVGLAPFGLALTPNISLVIVNRFSASYGGDQAIAVYACVAYIICVIYLILQGVGDGSQPLMSRYYGEGRIESLTEVKRMAYAFAFILAIIACVIVFLARWNIGRMFGSSEMVNAETAKIIPIFLVSVPFVSVTRISTAGFYATEKAALSYILTFVEPILMLAFMLVLPLFGGQIMIWWSTIFARILAAVLSVVLLRVNKKSEEKSNIHK